MGFDLLERAPCRLAREACRGDLRGKIQSTGYEPFDMRDSQQVMIPSIWERVNRLRALRPAFEIRDYPVGPRAHGPGLTGQGARVRDHGSGVSRRFGVKGLRSRVQGLERGLGSRG